MLTILVETVVTRTVEEHRLTLAPDAFRELLRNLADRFGQEAYAADHEHLPVNPICRCELCLNGELPAF